MTKLERLRKQYGVPAKRGARVSVYSYWKNSRLSGTVVGATTAGDLRVRYDGATHGEEFHIHPLNVQFLDWQK